MSELRSVLSEALVAELERLVDARVEVALAARADETSSPWLSLRDCAERLHVSERTITRLVKRRGIRTCTAGRRVLIHVAELDKSVRGDA